LDIRQNATDLRGAIEVRFEVRRNDATLSRPLPTQDVRVIVIPQCLTVASCLKSGASLGPAEAEHWLASRWALLWLSICSCAGGGPRFQILSHNRAQLQI